MLLCNPAFEAYVPGGNPLPTNPGQAERAEDAAFGNGLLESGMEIVTKPFSIDALANRIRQMIERP